MRFKGRLDKLSVCARKATEKPGLIDACFFTSQRSFGRCTRWEILVLISDCHRGMLKAAIQEVFS